MKKTALALSLLALSATAFAAEEETNYGDPTASFSTVGVAGSKDAAQVTSMFGFGNNIFSFDLGKTYKKDAKDGQAAADADTTYRGRYFYVTDGLGYSVDVVGNLGNGNNDKSTTVLAGALYKIAVNDNLFVFPMISAGRSLNEQKTNDQNLVQAGVYAMYAFDAGHWMYANPKVTRMLGNGGNLVKQNVFQAEIGGGYMVAADVSVGAKLEYTKANTQMKANKQKSDSTLWLQANYYF